MGSFVFVKKNYESSNLFIAFSYIHFSNAAARVLRRCLNENAKKEALKREEAYAKVNKWENGKMQPKKGAL